MTKTEVKELIKQFDKLRKKHNSILAELRKVYAEADEIREEICLLESKLEEAQAIHYCYNDQGTHGYANCFLEPKEDVVTFEGKNFCSDECLQEYKNIMQAKKELSKCYY